MANWSSSNHNNADEYVGSCFPYVTGSISLADGVGQGFEFPYVTRWIQVFNNGDTNGVRVGFTENGVNENPANTAHYFVVPPNTASAMLAVKCGFVWLAGDGGATTASLAAGYTNVPIRNFVADLTGSAGFSGIG